MTQRFVAFPQKHGGTGRIHCAYYSIAYICGPRLQPRVRIYNRVVAPFSMDLDETQSHKNSDVLYVIVSHLGCLEWKMPT